MLLINLGNDWVLPCAAAIASRSSSSPRSRAPTWREVDELGSTPRGEAASATPTAEKRRDFAGALAELATDGSVSEAVAGHATAPS